MGLSQVPLETLSDCFSCTLYIHIWHTWPVCSFTSTETASLFKILYHVRIGLYVGGSLWCFVRNGHWTITIDSHLANCSTQNTFSAPVNAIFHQLPLVVKFTRYALSTITNENLAIYSFFWYKCFHHVCHDYCSTGPWNPGGTFDLPCILFRKISIIFRIYKIVCVYHVQYFDVTISRPIRHNLISTKIFPQSE